jgi:hypothetical protein
MKKFKNNKEVADTWCGMEIQPSAYYELQAIELIRWQTDSKVLSDIGSGNGIMNDGTSDITDVATAIAFLRDDMVKDVKVTSQPDPVPFAQPTYRTKRDADTSWTTCAENIVTHSDFQLTAERYVSGGDIIFKDSKEGDYLSAEVRDVNGVIPEAYRAALCEAHPIVAVYINKLWVMPVSGYGSINIDTYPLNAKISAGLYLRVSYHATSEAGDRKMAVNYHLTKRL